jgi:predicted transposase YbfD/YdcC
VFSATRAVAGTDWQSLIKRIIRITRDVLHRDARTGLWSSTSEVAFYVANSTTSARRAATAIRHHWHVENALHYTRDVTFQEDQSRIRHNPGVFARVRSFAYNVLCRNQTSTHSQDRYAAALAGFDALATWRFSPGSRSLGRRPESGGKIRGLRRTDSGRVSMPRRRPGRYR